LAVTTHTLVRETVHASWLQKVFSDSVIKSELDRLDEFFKKELADFGDDVAILPQPFENIFRAFKEPLEQVNVVILGQDPYHANREEATGLAFAVNEGVPIPPSLRNIFKELSTDSARNFPKSTISDLDNWAQQGVLLLNTALTVRQKKPGSHLKEWQPFTDRIIEMLGGDPTHPRVFLLWGNAAQAKASLIQSHNEILTAAHPSPLSASRGWFGVPISQKPMSF
jgi:uracil-DNA glycosylase